MMKVSTHTLKGFTHVSNVLRPLSFLCILKTPTFLTILIKKIAYYHSGLSGPDFCIGFQ